MQVHEEKTALYARTKACAQEYVRPSSMETIVLIEWMDAADKLAKEAMRKALAKRAEHRSAEESSSSD